MTPQPPEAARALAAELRASRKYRYAAAETLDRVARWALERYKPRAAAKAAKRKLHQVYGAYFDQIDMPLIEAAIEQIPEQAARALMVETCTRILQSHASTRERLPINADFYARIFRETGPVSRIADIGCGLNPFALPWMRLDARAEYFPSDIDYRLMESVNRFLVKVGRPATATCTDILSTACIPEVDVVFMLKVIPCLEQQQKGGGLRLLRELRARWGVISFPAKSLGGREKGMAAHYGKYLEGLAGAVGAEYVHFQYPTELVYVLELR